MIEGILLKRYNNGEDVEMFGLTKNTIILCDNYYAKQNMDKVMLAFCEASKTYSDTDDGIQYSLTNDTEELTVQEDIRFLPTSIYSCTPKEEGIRQRFLVTVEATAIFTMQEIDDVWFCIETGNIFALSYFKGIKDTWDIGGVLAVYKNFVGGRYGCYTGEFLAKYKSKSVNQS